MELKDLYSGQGFRREPPHNLRAAYLRYTERRTEGTFAAFKEEARKFGLAPEDALIFVGQWLQSQKSQSVLSRPVTSGERAASSSPAAPQVPTAPTATPRVDVGQRPSPIDRAGERPASIRGGVVDGAFVEGHQVQAEDSRGAWLRMQLAHLKAGAPPDDGLLAELSVGTEPLCRAFVRNLQPSNAARWLALAGDFGAGKSHLLAVLRQAAHQSGWATCSLVANNAEGSLAQPQRHLPFLLDTVASPQSAPIGIVELLTEWLGNNHRHPLMNWARGREYSSEIARALVLFDKGVFHQQTIREVIGAKVLGARVGSPAYRRAACAHVRDVSEMLVSVGHQGLVILIDEIESVFRLSSQPSWVAALRSLAVYCCDPALKNVRVIFAVTPEARSQIDRDKAGVAREIGSQLTTPIEEKSAIRMLAAGLDSMSWHECPRLDQRQRIELATRLVRLHATAHTTSEVRIPEGLVRWLGKDEVSVRSAIGTLLGWLDCAR